MSSLIEMIRRAATEWVSKASLDELVMVLPKAVFESAPAPQSAAVDKKTRPEKTRTKISRGNTARERRKLRVPKQAGSFSQAAGQAILEKMGGLKFRTPEYNKMRDEICKEFRINRRQVAGYLKTMKESPDARQKRMNLARKVKVQRNGKHRTPRNDSKGVHATMTLTK